MKKETYIQLTGSFFALIAILHALRLIFGWEVVLGEWMVPMGVSIGASLAAAYLCYSAFTLKK